MSLKITQLEKRSAESFGNYLYEIHEDDQLIAEYWHDYRGDGHGIKFISGKNISSIPMRMTDFLLGGGPRPLFLSDYAIEYIGEHRPK